MSEDKLKSVDQMRLEQIHALGGVTYQEMQHAVYEATENVIKALGTPRPPQHIYMQDNTLTQLATLLGCPIEALTVENLANAIEAIKLATEHDYDSSVIVITLEAAKALHDALAPFKRGA